MFLIVFAWCPEDLTPSPKKFYCACTCLKSHLPIDPNFNWLILPFSPLYSLKLTLNSLILQWVWESFAPRIYPYFLCHKNIPNHEFYCPLPYIWLQLSYLNRKSFHEGLEYSAKTSPLRICVENFLTVENHNRRMETFSKSEASKRIA